MKKSLFFFAAAAIALTACTNDDDALQTGQVQNSNRAIAFDTYTAGTTRAGDPTGVMTTDKLKQENKGFGVYGFYHDNATYTSSLTPNFMFNEHVSWNGGWTYSPLKYWPNETNVDSQDPAATAYASHKDKLSFFAYAPYVNLTTSGDLWVSSDGKAYVDNAVGATGITAITNETTTGDPKVIWRFSNDLDNNVDLLWGVAPAGMSYTDVSGTDITVPVGEPLKNMVKPDKDQKMKFLFQHALSRIGLTVVSAIDQIAAGDDGNKYTTDQTRVLIEEVKIWGDFGTIGMLNLNNTTSNVANWEGITKSSSTEGSPLLAFDCGTTNGYIAPDLRYDASAITTIGTKPYKFAALNTGVLPSEQTLLSGDADPSKMVGTGASTPAFAYGKVYYKASGVGTDKAYVVATTTATEACDAYVKVGNDYKQVFKSEGGSSYAPLDGNSKQLYKLTDGTALTTGSILASATKYFKKTGTDGEYVYTEVTGDGSTTVKAGETYFTDASGTNTLTRAELSGNAYGSATYYTGLIPRYFMVVPSALPATDATKTAINVKITYHVVTKDTKLDGKVSNVSNAITKQTKIQLENGKSYNLKLILGLTSVKLAAEVADWQLADDTEIWLPTSKKTK